MQVSSAKEHIAAVENTARETILNSSKAGFFLINSSLELLFHTPSVQKLLNDSDSCHASQILEKLELNTITFRRIQGSIRKNGYWEGLYTRGDKLLMVVVTPAVETATGTVQNTGAHLVEVRDCTKDFAQLQKTREQHTLDTRVEKIRSEVLAQINHEFKTPLHAIIGYSEHILAEGSACREHQDYISEILHASSRLLNSVNEFMHSSRQNFDITINEEPINVRELAQECMSLLAPMKIKFRDVEVEITGQETLVYADRLRLKQVLLALASNAIRHNCKQGRVVIHIRELPRKLQIQLVDAGPGIPLSLQPSLFTLAGPPGNDMGGTCRKGIGLVICRKLLQHMQGELALASLPGVGSLFSLTLPLNRPQIIRNADKTAPRTVGLLWIGGGKEVSEFGLNLARLLPYCRFEHLQLPAEISNRAIESSTLLVIGSDYYLQNAALQELLKQGNVLVVNDKGIIETAAGARLDHYGSYRNNRLDMPTLTGILEELSRQ